MTDNLAKTILNAEYLFDIKRAIDNSDDYHTTHQELRRMARFWLIRGEIRDHFKVLVETGDPYETESEAALLANIEALEDNDE